MSKLKILMRALEDTENFKTSDSKYQGTAEKMKADLDKGKTWSWGDDEWLFKKEGFKYIVWEEEFGEEKYKFNEFQGLIKWIEKEDKDAWDNIGPK